MAVDDVRTLLTAEWQAALDHRLNPARRSGVAVSVTSVGALSETPAQADWEWIGFGVEEPLMYAGASRDAWSRAWDDGSEPTTALRDRFVAAWSQIAHDYGISVGSGLAPTPGEPSDLTADSVVLLCTISGSDGRTAEVVVNFVEPMLRMVRRSARTEALNPHLAGLSFSLHSTLGRATLTLESVLKLTPGALIDLGRSCTDPVDVHVNGRFIGCARVARCGEYYGICAIAHDAVAPEGLAG